MVQFDCDTYFDGANCHVELEKVHFVGFEGDDDRRHGGAQMTCKGTVGTAKDLKGINDCLR